MKFAAAYTSAFCAVALVGSAAAVPAPAATPLPAEALDRRQGFVNSDIFSNGISFSSLSLPTYSVPDGQSIASAAIASASAQEASLTTRQTTAPVASGTNVNTPNNAACNTVNDLTVCCPSGYSNVNQKCYQSINGNDAVINSSGGGSISSSSSNGDSSSSSGGGSSSSSSNGGGSSSSSSSGGSDDKGNGASSGRALPAVGLVIGFLSTACFFL